MKQKDSVFCFFYTRFSQPYLEYEIENSERKMPEALFIFSWRGIFGLPGGELENGESHLKGLQREITEELGYKSNLELFKYICSHQLDDEQVVHLYSYEVNQTHLEFIQDGFRSGSDSRAEIAGANLLQISEFGEFGLSAFLQNNLHFCVREELVIAIQELNLMSSKELTKICEKAGFNIEFLLKNKRI